ncbi:MAG: DoxX family protein [Dongiaceae bacterium]
MNDNNQTAKPGGIACLARCAFKMLERIPISLPVLVLRLGVAVVFFRSFLAKIASWQTTIMLFENEYNVPVLPPALAAYMAAAVELICPILLVLGLGTRLAAAAMLGMTLVIQVFVYPTSWPDHLLWAGPLLYLIVRGPGKWSLDAQLRDRLGGGP